MISNTSGKENKGHGYEKEIYKTRLEFFAIRQSLLDCES